MAVTDAGAPGKPDALRGVSAVDRPAPTFPGATRPTRPPTLGDKLHEVLRLKGQTTAHAAQAMGVTKAELLSWSADSEAPGVAGQAALQAYLEVDGRQLRALVLRGQMRLVQARIRN